MKNDEKPKAPVAKVETDAQKIERLTKEIIAECEEIAMARKMSCYEMVEKTKELMKLKAPKP